MNRRLVLPFILASVALAGCARRPEPSEWFEKAESAHRAADRLIGTGDVDGAHRTLEDALALPVPPKANVLDGRVVKQDLYYRLAVLDLSQNRPKEASATAARGLALGLGTDVFTANLHIVNGRALERMNDASAASREYHDALLVAEALLDKSLQGSKSQ